MCCQCGFIIGINEECARFWVPGHDDPFLHRLETVAADPNLTAEQRFAKLSKMKWEREKTIHDGKEKLKHLAYFYYTQMNRTDHMGDDVVTEAVGRIIPDSAMRFAVGKAIAGLGEVLTVKEITELVAESWKYCRLRAGQDADDETLRQMKGDLKVRAGKLLMEKGFGIPGEMLDAIDEISGSVGKHQTRDQSMD